MGQYVLQLLDADGRVVTSRVVGRFKGLLPSAKTTALAVKAWEEAEGARERDGTPGQTYVLRKER